MKTQTVFFLAATALLANSANAATGTFSHVDLFPIGTTVSALDDLPFESNPLNDHYDVTPYTFQAGQRITDPEALGVTCSFSVQKESEVKKGQSFTYDNNTALATDSPDQISYRDLNGGPITINQNSVTFLAGSLGITCNSNAPQNSLPQQITAKDIQSALNGVFAFRTP